LLAFARYSRFLEHLRQIALQGRNIEEKALARLCMAQDFKNDQDISLELFLVFVVLLKNSE